MYKLCNLSTFAIELTLFQPCSCNALQIDKARAHLGYDPQLPDLAEVGAWYKEQGFGPVTSASSQRHCKMLVLWAFLIITTTGILAFAL